MTAFEPLRTLCPAWVPKEKVVQARARSAGDTDCGAGDYVISHLIDKPQSCFNLSRSSSHLHRDHLSQLYTRRLQRNAFETLPQIANQRQLQAGARMQ
jgi:hypothetical protein